LEIKKVISRKCSECETVFEINESNIHEVIYYNKSYYHINCFIAMCNRKASKKNASEQWITALKNIEEIKRQSYNFINESFVKDELFNFMVNQYGMKVIPTTIWTKLDSIYVGSYKGMTVGIPPEHLLDMWQRQIAYLNKVAFQNASKGKTMSKEQRINYDLSILVNKYDSYLEWLNKQKIIEFKATIQDNDDLTKVNYQAMSKHSNTHKEKDNHDEMDDILNDIFH
jgi:hypothetical protein